MALCLRFRSLSRLGGAASQIEHDVAEHVSRVFDAYSQWLRNRVDHPGWDYVGKEEIEQALGQPVDLHEPAH